MANAPINHLWTVYTYWAGDPESDPARKSIYTLTTYAPTMEEAMKAASSKDYYPIIAELQDVAQAARNKSGLMGFKFTRERLNTLLAGSNKEPKVAEPKLAKPPIGLPPEVHATAKFDPDLAWRAIRIAAGDPPPGE